MASDKAEQLASTTSVQKVLSDVRHVLRTCLINCTGGELQKHLPPSFYNEFDDSVNPNPFQIRREAQRRILQDAFRRTFDVHNLGALTASFGTVWSIGTYEGWLVTRSPHQSIRFAIRYGLHQILPSIIWLTTPADLVARRAGYNPDVILRTFTKPSPQNAYTQLRIMKAQCTRSVIAGFLGIAQVFRLVQVFSDASTDYEERVSVGREPFFGGISPRERVIRLAGTASDVTELSMTRFGADHFVPVVEIPSKASSYIESYSQGRMRPVIWHIPNDTYGRPTSWGAKRRDLSVTNSNEDFDFAKADFKIGREWTLQVGSPSSTTNKNLSSLPFSNKKRILVVEADSSVGEQALALGIESSNDMSISEASLGFRMIEKLAREQGALTSPEDKVVRILLADSMAPQTTGGGRTYTLREHVVENDSADVLIDAKLPLLKAIVEWAEQTSNRRWCGEDEEQKQKHANKLFFDTSNMEYFSTVRSVLASYGWEVLDGSWHCSEEYSNIPVIVYDDSTAVTVNSVRSLLEKRGVPPFMVCALIDQFEGQGDLDRLTRELGCEGEVGSVCSAVVYDYLFQAVRVLLRAGMEENEIQAFLDNEFSLVGRQQHEKAKYGANTSR